MNHKLIYNREIFINKVNNLNELRNKIDKIKDNIDKIVEKLNKFKNNLEIYYNISNKIINNYDIKKSNYQILMNINK